MFQAFQTRIEFDKTSGRIGISVTVTEEVARAFTDAAGTLVVPVSDIAGSDSSLAATTRCLWSESFRGRRASADSVPTQLYCCVMIPEFNEHGNLPPGIHHATWSEIVTRYATNVRRRELLDGLLDALRSLKGAGCATAYLDGSLVTSKDHPGDFDACWESSGVTLNRLDSELLTFSDGRAAQKARYGGELYPAEWPANADGTTYLDFFQRDRLKQQKGIIAIDMIGLP